jgi:hypothetical protein
MELFRDFSRPYEILADPIWIVPVSGETMTVMSAVFSANPTDSTGPRFQGNSVHA